MNTGAALPFTTGSLPSDFPTNTFTVNVPATAHDAAYPVLMFQAVYPTAVDLSGNVLWYFPNNTGTGLSVNVLALPRMERNGLFYSIPTPTVVQQYNLAGNLVMQTNLAIVNEQLVALGYPMIKQFNSHEVRNLPDGNIGLLGIIDMKSTTAQGGTPAKPVNIEGDMVLVLDHNLHLLWAWNSFDHQDVTRAATDGDLTSGGTQDWTHTNALQGTLDGNIIISERAQDWALKINYGNGKGDGSVIWRMGAGGDFTITNPPAGSCLDPASNNPSSPGGDNLIPWFDHQHDVHLDFEDQASGDGFMIMTVFDDGNTRHDKCPGTQNSRGMVLLVNEAARQVTYATVADLGAYSLALGSAQLLTPGDGNIYSSFDSGIIMPGGLTQVSEVNLAGQIVYQMQSNQETYRAYRMSNLYTPSEFEVTPPAGIENGLPSNLPFDFSTGFARNRDAVELNGNASISGDVLQLTDGGTNEASSVFYNSPVNVQTFTTDFTFQQTSAAADGFTFTIQNASPNALGSLGGSLGYQHIAQSVAIKFDLYSNGGEGTNSTGLFTNGANPTTPSFDLTGSGVNLHSADSMDAHITYDGTTLMLTLTDLVTKATYTHAFSIDIPGTIGSTTGYVGFTAGTGGSTAIQQVMSWSYEPIMVPYQPMGFPAGTTSIALNGSSTLSGSSIELTNGLANEAGSAYFMSPVNVQAFNTDFDFLQTDAEADGFTFVVQNAGLTALGSIGGGLGYQHIGSSVAIKFDLYNNAGEGRDSIGMYSNGAAPILPSIDLSGTGINFHSGDGMHAHISYDGNVLTLTLTDLVTGLTYTHPFAINIPTIVAGNTAYVGFTAGTGGSAATQQILNWTFE